MDDPQQLTPDQWRERLTAEQYRVTREKGTEAPFTGKYASCSLPGTYKCVCCSTRLFEATDKFDSGTGWPSYMRPATPEAVRTETDASLGMRRVEVLCTTCDAHLGHVFDDGPPPTGLRYCINSASLVLEEA